MGLPVSIKTNSAISPKLNFRCGRPNPSEVYAQNVSSCSVKIRRISSGAANDSLILNAARDYLWF